MKEKYNCIFGGGGIRGMCYIGAVDALNECGIELDAIAGSSVGAVFASLFAAGYSTSEIKDIFLDFNLNMFRDLNITIFTPDISISKGEIFLDWLREKLSTKLKKVKKISSDNKVKFKDLDKKLYILTVDLNTNTPFVFSKETTPDEEVAIAVRASASLPGLMKPVNYGDSILVDGDLIKSWPAWKIFNQLNNSESRLLEFRLEGSRDNTDIKNPMDYINSIINAIWYLSTENVFQDYHENDKYDYIVIDTKDIIMFDFNIDNETKNKLIEKGYYITKNYLEKTLVYKKKNLIEKYLYIYEKINLCLKLIKESNFEKSICSLNEILSDSYDNSLYIDKYYYIQIKQLKELLCTNIKKGFLFARKLENKREITEKTIFITNLLEKRIVELKKYITKFSNNC